VAELVFNVALPAAVMSWGSSPERLGPVWGLVVALSSPLGFSAWTVARDRRVSPLALVMVVSVLLTGGIGLLELDVRWFAWKEAAVPGALALLATASLSSRWPAVAAVLDPLLDHEIVDAALDARGQRDAHAAAMRRATARLAAALAVSAGIGFAFARWMVTSPTGTEAFTAELGAYTGWSYLVVGGPSAAMMVWVLRDLLDGLVERTGLELEELLA
jgi:hypothetical protein